MAPAAHTTTRTTLVSSARGIELVLDAVAALVGHDRRNQA